MLEFSPKGKGKGKKTEVYSSSQTASPLQNSHAIWDHTVLRATWQRWHCRLYPSQL